MVKGWRTATLGPPILMSDALSNNQVHDIPFINALCNAQGRRDLAELVDFSPRQARFALDRYCKRHFAVLSGFRYIPGVHLDNRGQ